MFLAIDGCKKQFQRQLLRALNKEKAMRKRKTSMASPNERKEPQLKLELLSMVDIFRDLREEEVQEINGMVDMITIRKGHILYHPDEEAEVLFLLKKGRIQVYTLTPEGNRLMIETIGPGTFFGEMPLTAQSMHQAFAEATEDSLVCVLSKGDLDRLLHNKPSVAVRLVEILGTRLKETQARLEELTIKAATVRVSRGLLRLAHGNSELRGLTHQDLADSVGLQRETVSRALHQLQDLGLVQLGTKNITILSVIGLEEEIQKLG